MTGKLPVGGGALPWPGSAAESEIALVEWPQGCVPGCQCEVLVVLPLRGLPEMLGVPDRRRLSVGKPRDVRVGSILIETGVEGRLGWKIQQKSGFSP